MSPENRRRFPNWRITFSTNLPKASLPAGPFGKVVLAVPGAYLKDATIEEEKVGLLLGMAHELKFPLAGIVEMGCAALCDPRAGGFASALPVMLVDVHLQGTDLGLYTADERLARSDFLNLPQYGLAQLLKHLTAAMGNRFLRHTAFDILEDGRIEQIFFRQTKNFLMSRAAEQRFEINTATRNYEMLAKQEQLAGDAQPFVNGLLQAVQAFVQNSGNAPAGCTLALTERASWLPGLEARLRAMGFRRFLRLPNGRGGVRRSANRGRPPVGSGGHGGCPGGNGGSTQRCATSGDRVVGSPAAKNATPGTPANSDACDSRRHRPVD